SSRGHPRPGLCGARRHPSLRARRRRMCERADAGRRRIWRAGAECRAGGRTPCRRAGPRGRCARQQGRRGSHGGTGTDRPGEKPVSPMQRPEGVDLAARSRSRRRALQAIYAWQVGGNRMIQVIEQFRHEQDMEIADLEYFEDLLRGVEKNLAELDAAIRAHIDREIAEVDPIERAVMRIGAYELRHRLDVPYRVVINEALEVTKRFGADQGHTFVNGVLDKLAGEWRAVEYRN